MIGNNCTDRSTNIYLNAVDNNTITGNFCSNAIATGIYLTGSSSNIISNNTCLSNLYGIRLDPGSNYNQVINNTVNFGGWMGIYLASSLFNNITSNHCISNANDGINLNGACTDDNVMGNLCNGNSQDGIFVLTSTIDLIQQNTCVNNAQNGIYILSSSWIQIINNNCTGSFNGIALFNSLSSTIDNNTCNLNNVGTPNCGISLLDSNNTIIQGNICNGMTGGTGIYLLSSCNDTILYNTCNSNACGISINSARITIQLLGVPANSILMEFGITRAVLANVLDNNCTLNTELALNLQRFGNNSLIQQNNCLKNTIFSVIDIDTSNDIDDYQTTSARSIPNREITIESGLKFSNSTTK